MVQTKVDFQMKASIVIGSQLEATRSKMIIKIGQALIRIQCNT